MFANLNRDDFIALLNRLGSPIDADALAAARDLHARVTVAGVSWNELLVPQRPGDEIEKDVDAIDLPADVEDVVLVAPEADRSALSDADKDEAKALIDALGALELSEATRDELKDYADDLAAGTLEQMDLRYLRALKKRLKA